MGGAPAHFLLFYRVMWILIPTSLLSLACLWGVWTSRNTVPRKLAWSFFLLLPILGPILYGSCYSPPARTGKNPSEPSSAAINAANFMR